MRVLLLLAVASFSLETPFTPYKDGYATPSTWFGTSPDLVVSSEATAWVNHALFDGEATNLIGARLSVYIADITSSGRLEVRLATSLGHLENQTKLSHLHAQSDQPVGFVDLDGSHLEEMVSIPLSADFVQAVKSGLYDGLVFTASLGMQGRLGAVESSRGAILWLQYAQPSETGAELKQKVVQELKQDEAFLQSLQARAALDVDEVARKLRIDSLFIETLQGEKGEPGLVGPSGPQGVQGPVGPQGPEGRAGTNFRIDSLGSTEKRVAWTTAPKGFVWGDSAAQQTTLFMAVGDGQWTTLGKLTAAQRLEELQGRLAAPQLPPAMPDSLARTAWVQRELDRKADAISVGTILSSKADQSWAVTELAKKADSASLNSLTRKLTDGVVRIRSLAEPEPGVLIDMREDNRPSNAFDALRFTSAWGSMRYGLKLNSQENWATELWSWHDPTLKGEYNSSNGGLIFSTGAGGTRDSSKERMRIDPQGKVGIGTSAPVAHLDVAGGTRSEYFHTGNSLWCNARLPDLKPGDSLRIYLPAHHEGIFTADIALHGWSRNDGFIHFSHKQTFYGFFSASYDGGVVTNPKSHLHYNLSTSMSVAASPVTYDAAAGKLQPHVTYVNKGTLEAVGISAEIHLRSTGALDPQLIEAQKGVFVEVRPAL